jgi:hypothetical protein
MRRPTQIDLPRQRYADFVSCCKLALPGCPGQILPKGFSGVVFSRYSRKRLFNKTPRGYRRGPASPSCFVEMYYFSHLRVYFKTLALYCWAGAMSLGNSFLPNVCFVCYCSTNSSPSCSHAPGVEGALQLWLQNCLTSVFGHLLIRCKMSRTYAYLHG